MIRPGEVYSADFEEMEPHPVVVVSREELNRGNWVVAVLITSKRFEERIEATTLRRFPRWRVRGEQELRRPGRIPLFHTA